MNRCVDMYVSDVNMCVYAYVTIKAYIILLISLYTHIPYIPLIHATHTHNTYTAINIHTYPIPIYIPIYI